jgi:hypothetical protein
VPLTTCERCESMNLELWFTNTVMVRRAYSLSASSSLPNTMACLNAVRDFLTRCSSLVSVGGAALFFTAAVVRGVWTSSPASFAFFCEAAGVASKFASSAFRGFPTTLSFEGGEVVAACSVGDAGFASAAGSSLGAAVGSGTADVFLLEPSTFGWVCLSASCSASASFDGGSVDELASLEERFPVSEVVSSSANTCSPAAVDGRIASGTCCWLVLVEEGSGPVDPPLRLSP